MTGAKEEVRDYQKWADRKALFERFDRLAESLGPIVLEITQTYINAGMEAVSIGKRPSSNMLGALKITKKVQNEQKQT